MSSLALRDREARKVWKEAFFDAYAAIGTPSQAEAVRALGEVASVYLTINQEAKAAGVDYDPRKAKIVTTNNAYQKTQYANYKGRVYLLIYQGQKDGKTISKLAFLDRSKEFWASADYTVTPCKAPSASSANPTGQRSYKTRAKPPCGYPGCDGVTCDDCC